MRDQDEHFVQPTEHVPSTAPDVGEPGTPLCVRCSKRMPFGPHVVDGEGHGYCSVMCAPPVPRPTDGLLEEYRVAEAKKRNAEVRAAADKITDQMMGDGENPKHAMGVSKVPILSVVPTTAITYIALAMRYGAFEAIKKDGSLGYGPYNWRETKIYASVYVDAAMRHIMAVWDGEWLDADSGVPHLGHAMACLALWADAKEMGTLVDDRPMPGNAAEMFRLWKKTP